MLLEEVKVKMLLEGAKYWKERRGIKNYPELCNPFEDQEALKKAVEIIDEMFYDRLHLYNFSKERLKRLMEDLEKVDVSEFL